MKPKLIIANWKMNTSFDEAQDLIIGITEALESVTLETGVVLCPPALYLEVATDHADDCDLFNVGAQNCSEYDNGAYTGEISARMLASIGVDFCIVGHSERRKYFNESNETIAKKVNQLLQFGLVPVVCCGETREERKTGHHYEVVEKQLAEALFQLPKEHFEQAVIAYEPIWAIGTGETASPQQAQEMHAFIRNLIEKKFGTETAYNSYILYGGSCNAQNAVELFSQNDVDGGLIGGASLKADDFVAIIEAGETAIKEN
jgi:triosephosphate isomerase